MMNRINLFNRGRSKMELTRPNKGLKDTMSIRALMLASLMACLSLPIQAQEIRGPNGEEPDVTIRDDGDQRVEEYRINGILYSIKITPKDGTPYYMVRSDEDGNMIRADKPEFRIPSWKIFTW